MTNTKLDIREAGQQDAALILQFIRDLAEYERELTRVSATEAIIHAAFFGPQPHAKALIVDAAQEPAAFAIYFFSFSSFPGFPNLYIEDIFVRPAYRGLGIGKQLMAHLARIANENNCGRMEWAVLNWNESAIRFYESLGAQPVKDWTVFHLEKPELTQLAGGAES